MNTQEINSLFKQYPENYRTVDLNFISFKQANAFCKEMANAFASTSLNIEYKLFRDENYKSSLRITYNVRIHISFGDFSKDVNKGIKQLITKYRKHII